ncbi:MAG: hypothetical protein RL297_490 [Pseudomonadota bacterium]
MCHAIKKPVGGVKVIYRQAELANQLLQPFGHSASVMHPNTIFFRVKWFSSDVCIRRPWFMWRWMGKPSLSVIKGRFDSKRHVVVIPELWARKYGDQLANMGVPYAIYVQNGYYITKGDPKTLNLAYEKARCILTISEDASRCVAMAFPGTEDRILRIHYSVDAQRFNPNRSKENLITYMPRKLADHSSKVLFFLRNHLPGNWRIQAIDGLNESGVADLLARSKIFMSFSHFEGCPLPPLEAALCGNHVVGYTGQGGKEYWFPDIFETVESGDVVEFSKRVLEKVAQLDDCKEPTIRSQSIQRLSKMYSSNQEQLDIGRLIERLGLN